MNADNAMVSRMITMTTTQDREEGTRNIAARLRGQAKVCEFSKNCSHNPLEAVNYTDDRVCDAHLRELGDSDIQKDVLGNKDRDMTLDDTIKFIEADEAAKDQHVVKCQNCVKPCHDDGRDTQAGKEKCKTWDKNCSMCDKKNRFANV